MRARLKPISGVREGGSVCLPKEKGNYVVKQTQRESDGEIEEIGGGKKRRDSEDMDLMMEVGSQPCQHQ